MGEYIYPICARWGRQQNSGKTLSENSLEGRAHLWGARVAKVEEADRPDERRVLQQQCWAGGRDYGQAISFDRSNALHSSRSTLWVPSRTRTPPHPSLYEQLRFAAGSRQETQEPRRDALRCRVQRVRRAPPKPILVLTLAKEARRGGNKGRGRGGDARPATAHGASSIDTRIASSKGTAYAGD